MTKEIFLKEITKIPSSHGLQKKCFLYRNIYFLFGSTNANFVPRKSMFKEKREREGGGGGNDRA